MPAASLFRLALLPALLLPSLAAAQQTAPTDRIASKSISRVAAVERIVFALAEDGRSFSWLNLFESPVKVKTVEWPYDGPAELGAPWRQSILLRAHYFISDSTRAIRFAAHPAQAVLTSTTSYAVRGDSLIFKDTALATANGAGLTAIAVRGDTALFGFGRLGLAYVRLNTASEITGPLVAPTDTTISFLALPSLDSNVRPLTPCRWNRLCRADTTVIPVGGLDSVISVAIDTSTADSTWILIATQKGLRRGLWRGTSFPYVALPDTAPESVRSVFTHPTQNRAWAFTRTKFFYSDNHGATFRVPPPICNGCIEPSAFTNFLSSMPPQVAFSGDTSFINFNMTEVGLARFRKDSLLLNAVGMDLDQALINANDSLDIQPGEGSLTGVTVARNNTQAVLVTGTTLKGIFYRRLDLPGKTFVNLTSRAELKGGLAEVITYPTLFTGPGDPASPQYVRFGYRLKKSGRVTITVYNYAMEKVKVVVRNAPRQGGIARSENIGEDRWDGRDSGGRLVSVGTYYVRVESDQGEAAFGKVICVRGRR
jgi:hypothetical protein